ncbi:MAG: hypothetical protein ACMUEM_07530 [Flavobacteriales bacterium AspAUS03]
MIRYLFWFEKGNNFVPQYAKVLLSNDFRELFTDCIPVVTGITVYLYDFLYPNPFSREEKP